MCDAGATVVFQKHGGWIEKPNGEKSTFRRDGDSYLRDVWVPRGQTFNGPTAS